MKNERKTQRLISLLIDKSISDDQLAELNSILKDSVEARLMYKRMVDLEYSISEFSIRSKRNPIITIVGWITVAAALLAISSVMIFNKRKAPEHFELINSWQANWNDKSLKHNSALLEGSLFKLNSGEALIGFGQARIRLKGPAEFNIQDQILSVHKGTIAVKTNKKKLIVKVPEGSIVNRGTEYSIEVKETTKVFVFEGEVDIQLNEVDSPYKISANEGALLNAQKLSRFESGEFSSSILKYHEKETESYADKIRRSRPLIYWGFEKGNEKPVLPSYAVIHELPTGNKVADFRNTPKGNLVISHELRTSLFTEAEMTFECWFKISEKAAGTDTVIAVKNKNDIEERYAFLVEFTISPENASLRSVIRHRESEKVMFNNSLKEKSFNWNHLAIVRDNDRTICYINGQLLEEILHESIYEPVEKTYNLSLGCKQLESESPHWFQSQIDEISIHTRVLGESEIRDHFKTGLRLFD